MRIIWSHQFLRCIRAFYCLIFYALEDYKLYFSISLWYWCSKVTYFCMSGLQYLTIERVPLFPFMLYKWQKLWRINKRIFTFISSWVVGFLYVCVWSTINTYIHLSILCYSLNSSQIELNYFTECLPYTAHPSRVRHVTTRTPSSFPLLASHERVVFQTFSA